jgi:hypothetical protein
LSTHTKLISSDDWQDWYFHPNTREFKKKLESAILDEKLLNRQFSEQSTIIKDFFFSEGRCHGLRDAIELINDCNKED